MTVSTAFNKPAMIAAAAAAVVGTGILASFYVCREQWLAGIKRLWSVLWSKGMGNDASKGGGGGGSGLKTATKRTSLKSDVKRPSCGGAIEAEERQSLLLTPSLRASATSDGSAQMPKGGSEFDGNLETDEDSEDDDNDECTNGTGTDDVDRDSAVADALFRSKREPTPEELTATLDSLFCNAKVITEEEARRLNALLCLKAPETLLKVLTTLSNLAPFTLNQNLFRQIGVLKSLTELLDDCTLTDAEKVMLVQCIGNVAVNQSNNKYLQVVVPRLVKSCLSNESTEMQRITTLQTLTNLSVDIPEEHAPCFATLLPVLFERVTTGGHSVVVALKLLGNLTSSIDMAPYLLSTSAVPCLMALLDRDKQSAEVIVRSLNYLTNLYKMAENPEVIRHVLDEQLLPVSELPPSSLLSKSTVDELGRRLVSLHNYPNAEIADRIDYLMELVEEFYYDG